jgi:hypothetical protein
MKERQARLELGIRKLYPLKNIRGNNGYAVGFVETMIEENPTRVIIAKVCLIS